MFKRKFKWNSEKILGLSAMGISFITLVIFIYQTNLMRRQNSLSVLPYLQISISDNAAASSYSLALLNHGVGPAIIESVQITYDNKHYNLKEHNDYFIDFLRAAEPTLDSLVSFSSSTTERGMAIPPGASYPVLSVNNSGKDYHLLKFHLEKMLSDGLEYEVIYKNIQDEKWSINNHSEGPVKLD